MMQKLLTISQNIFEIVCKREKPPTVISTKYLPSSKTILYLCVQLYSMVKFSEYWILKEQNTRKKKGERV